MVTKHWSWGHFTTDNQFFQNNNFYKNAWCIACVKHHKELLRQADIASAAVAGRTDADREAQGIVLDFFEFHCGINRLLQIHIAYREDRKSVV